MSDLVVINGADFGLQETKAKEISGMFQPMLDKMVELENEYNEVIKLEVNDDTAKLAKTTRLKYVKIRTETAKIHKELKKFYLQGGKFVDGWKNAQLMASQGIEKKLMDIEKYEEMRLKKLWEERRVERTAELNAWGVEDIPITIGEMDNEIWKHYINGVQEEHDRTLEAERKAKVEAEKAETERQEELKRMKIESNKLKEKERKLEIERRNVEDEKRKIAEDKAAELKAIEDKKEAELSKSDEMKIKSLIIDLAHLADSYTFTSQNNIKIYKSVGVLINKTIQFIAEKTTKKCPECDRVLASNHCTHCNN